MDTVSLNISEVAKQVIERYVGKKDYAVRIRINKKDSKNKVELIVYYDGRKSFEVKSDKLILDGAYFFAKGNKKFAAPIDSEIASLTALGFSFKMGSKINRKDPYYEKGYRYCIYVDPSSAEGGSKKHYDNYKDEIKGKMDLILTALKKWDNDFIHVYDSETNKNSFYTKSVDNTIKYSELKELLKEGIDNTVTQNGIKKINFNETLVSPKKIYTEEEYSIIDSIMGNRIKNYNFGNDEKEDEVDNSEKMYQQLLMNKMFNKDERKKLLAIDNCPFKDSYAFEMEYNLYADNRTYRNEGTKKGRIDNIFINGNKILFTELKYDEKVIGGTNGIHKHLIDLINGFEYNDEAFSEIYDYVCDYNGVLSCFDSKKEYLIENISRFKDREVTREFIIICGYSKGKREAVYSELERVYSLTAKAAKVEKTYDFSDILTDKEEKHLENMTVKDLISLLKEIYNCETKIFLVDDNYTKFETYQM